MKLSKDKIFNYIKRYAILCIGLFLYAFAFNLFMVPNNFVVGGVSGISIILYKFLGFDTSITVSILSTFLLIIGFIFCNKDRMYSSVASTFLLPIFIEITSYFTNLITLDISLLLSSVYCSILVGVAVGLVYKVGFSTGGTDILYWIIEKYIKKSTGSLMIMVEGVIIFVGALVFGFQRLMYSLIILFIMSRLSDKLVIGISDSKLLCIIPYKYDEINEFLNSLSFVRSVRLMTDSGKDVIYCIVTSKDYPLVYEGIRKIDKKAFLSVNNTYETKGGYSYE
jgi:uncharacterized membrane-anchored protein YitT (DUF2179 family)